MKLGDLVEVVLQEVVADGGHYGFGVKLDAFNGEFLVADAQGALGRGQSM